MSRRLITPLVLMAAAVAAMALGVLLLLAAQARASRLSPATSSCSIYWTGTTSTDWATKTNWSLSDGGTSAGRVPTSTDAVCMSTAPHTATVILSSSTTATVTTISWPKTSTVNPSLTVNGTFSVGNKTAVGASTISQLDLESTMTEYKAGTLVVGSFVLNGNLIGAGTVTVSGTTSIPGNPQLGTYNTAGSGVHLVTQGSTTLPASSTVYFTGGSVWENSGVLTLSDSDDLYNDDGLAGNQLSNDAAATITYAGSSISASTYIAVAAPNAGTVSVSKGTLYDGSGSTTVTDSGTFTAATGSSLYLQGTRTESSGATATGAGLVDVSGAVTFTANGNLSNTGTFEVDGTLTASSGVTVTSANLTLYGSLVGPGTVTVTGPLSVPGNPTLGAYNTSGSGVRLITRGSTTLASSSTVYFDGGSVWENQGSLALSDGDNLYNYDGLANQLVNDSGATVSYAGSSNSASASIAVAAPNAGTVSVSRGTLYDGGGSAAVTDSGSFTAAAGSSLDLEGTRTESSGATATGSGLVDVSGAVTFTANGNLSNTGTFEVDGTLTASSGVTVTAANLTLDGTLVGPGTVTVTGPTTMNSNASLGAYQNTAAAGRLITQGATTVVPSATVYFYADSVWENQGTLTLSDSDNLDNYDGFAGSELINDSGATVSYPGGSSSASTTIGVASPNAGTVSVSRGTLYDGGGSGSSTVTDSGTFTAAAGSVLDLQGTRTESSGATAAGAGLVDVQGAVTFTSNGNLSNTGSFEVDGTLTASSGVTVTAANLTLDGDLAGPGTVTVTGLTTLSAGAGLGLYQNTAAAVRLVTKGATTVVPSATVYFYADAVWENQGTLTLSDSDNLYNYDGYAGNELINDAGATVTYPGGSSSASATIGVTAPNAGTVSVSRGTLYDGGGSATVTDSGTFTAAAGSSLYLEGTRTEASGATAAGAGLVDVQGAVTFTANGNLSNTGSFEVDGTLTASSGVTVTAANLTLDGDLAGPGTVTVTGPTAMNNGASLGVYQNTAAAGRLITQGATTVASSATVEFYADAVWENQGTLTLSDNGNLNNYDGYSGNELINDLTGTISYTGGSNSASTSIGVALSDAGTLVAAKGTLSVGNLLNIVGSQLSGGTYSATAGTLSLPSAVTTNAATLLVGTTGVISSGGTNELAGLTTNSGTIRLSRSETVTNGLSNSGTIDVAIGTLQAKTYTQTAGTTIVESGASLKSGTSGTAAVLISGGALTGNGTVLGAVSGGGGVTPGRSAGPLTVTGTYAPSSSAALNIGISGPSSVGTDFGQLSVSGAASLSGALAVTTAPGYNPPAGTTYTILTAGSVTGTFSSVTGLTSGSTTYTLGYTATSVTLTVGAVAGQAPAVTSASSATFAVGSAGSFSVTATGSPTPSLAESGTLPSGVTFVDNGNGSGTLAGTPAAGSAGSYSVTFTASNGVSPNAVQSFTLTVNPAASGTVVTGLTPSALAQGVKSFSVKINGTGFATSGTTTVSASGSGITFASVKVSSATLITAKVTVTASAATGARNVTVTQGGQPTTCTGCLTVDGPATITGLSPSTLATGASHAVTISGTGFVAGATVTFSGASKTVTGKVTQVTSTAITVTVTVTSAAATGPHTVTVVNGDGGSVVDTNGLTVIAGPTISSISPSSVARSTSTAVTITGTGFTADLSLVVPKGCTASNISVSADGTQITFTLTVSSKAKAASKQAITVTDGAQGGYGAVTSTGLTIT